ncbi:MAG: desulfoferrodoxin family protein [Armatimonadota bacterium]
MDIFVCKVCGHAVFGEVPEKCPVCGARKESFVLTPDAFKKPADPDNLTEGDKKHIPVIDFKTDAQIKIGEIIHVMEEKHYIVYIDIYHDYKFMARYHMAPGAALNPELSIHLKVESGKFTVIEFCNVHGRWMSEVQI